MWIYTVGVEWCWCSKSTTLLCLLCMLLSASFSCRRHKRDPAMERVWNRAPIKRPVRLQVFEWRLPLIRQEAPGMWRIWCRYSSWSPFKRPHFQLPIRKELTLWPCQVGSSDFLRKLKAQGKITWSWTGQSTLTCPSGLCLIIYFLHLFSIFSQWEKMKNVEHNIYYNNVEHHKNHTKHRKTPSRPHLWHGSEHLLQGAGRLSPAELICWAPHRLWNHQL